MRSSIQLLSLAATVAGTPLSSEAIQSGSAPAAVTVAQLDAFKFYGQHAAAAYCNSATPAGNPIACTQNVCDSVKATVVSSFNGPLTGIGGYVSLDKAREEIVFSVRGSSNIRNFISDLVFAYAPCDLDPQCLVHAGFLAAWDEIQLDVFQALTSARAANPTYRIVATGHSLGAAVATLGAAFLRRSGFPMDTYTYGSPRVGNSHFSDFVTNQQGAEYRVTHLDDPVPRVPPLLFGYRHTTPEYWLAAGNETTVAFGPADVRVCAGNANVDCNAGTFGLDITAHGYYFEETAACRDGSLEWKRDGDEDEDEDAVTDDELLQRLNKWSQQDQEFARGLTADP